MRKLAIGLALASTALASPSMARDGSWYVGVDGGARAQRRHGGRHIGRADAHALQALPRIVIIEARPATKA